MTAAPPRAERERARRPRSPSCARSRARSATSGRCADARRRPSCAALGLEVDEDDERRRRPARRRATCWPACRAAGERTILLCAHLDTVAADGPDRAGARRRGLGRTRDDAILGADNKAAVAVDARWPRAARAAEPAPVGHRAAVHRLRGERRCAGRRRSTRRGCGREFGYVFDHATPIGEMILASPTYYRHRRRVPRRRRPRRHPPGGGPQRDRGRGGARSPRCAWAASTSGTTANVGAHRGRRRVDQRRRRPLPRSRPRPRRSTTSARRGVVGRDGRPHRTTARNALRVRRGRRSSSALFPGYRAAGAPPAGRWRPRRRCARCGHEPSHIVTGGGVGRQRARSPRGFPA